MENKNKNKFENFASHFHDEERDKLTENTRDDADFNATEKIYTLRDKVNQLARLSQVEYAWKKIEWKLGWRKSHFAVSGFKNFRYAAVFLMLVALTGVLGVVIYRSSHTESKEKITAIASSTGEIREVRLPDESTVWIGANSTLKYRKTFGKENREVHLVGEAMFDVNHNSQTFSVKLGNAEVDVHGTKFLITSYKNGNKNEVVLLEGKVKYHREDQTVLMAPGERISDNRITGDISKDQIKVDHYNEWINGKVYLDNNELDDLTFLLEQWYGVEFTFGNDSLKTYKFTGAINKTKSLDYNLNIITLTNKVKFQKDGGVIIIGKN